MSTSLIIHGKATDDAKANRGSLDQLGTMDYVLVDCSISMLDKWWQSLGAVDAYIGQAHLDGVRSRCILHMFYDEAQDYIHFDGHINDWVSLTKGENTPGPTGTTPLYNAVNLMGRRLASLDPEKASIVIVTDGDDNHHSGPNDTSLAQARAILDWCRAKGWQVTFVGADFSNARQAGLLGASKAEAIGVQKGKLTDAAKELGKKRARYDKTGAPMHWTEDEQQQFGGYLAPPKG